ncbi:MAG: efflux RND transporter periplasmic adaptor subunit, partial [Myxococcota bacterium]
MRRLSLVPVLSALVLFGVACSGGPGADAAAPAKAPEKVSVETAVATLRDVPRALRVTGTLVAVDDADVAAEAAGVVEKVLAERG